MTNQEILSHIDHTALKAVSAWEDIYKLCEEALCYKTASVCIPPCYVKRAGEQFPALNICTVIGFPLGYNAAPIKKAEAALAIENGASEIDMVVNLCDLKNKNFDNICAEISALREICGKKILKVIVETCYLNRDEKIALCKIVTEAKADFIKTSTGFGTGGAEREDIELFKQHIGGSVKIKASGGIKTRKDMEDFLALGCERLGTSSASVLF
ncbi:MAG: deoxyribose-phosphate aldolase [Spirochaetaceae bacterium]|jgi:deoxyribose-phosphate aldolase|nr:deoxyribose-phosphate aldolase [Spirochaetaceae bacterium]